MTALNIAVFIRSLFKGKSKKNGARIYYKCPSEPDMMECGECTGFTAFMPRVGDFMEQTNNDGSNELFEIKSVVIREDNDHMYRAKVEFIGHERNHKMVAELKKHGKL